MSEVSHSPKGQWSGRFAYILAATGAAVGLGNIWKFPYIMGENGGGAFVLVYLICIALIGIPVMMAEVAIGKRGRKSPTNSVNALIDEAGAKPWWKITGWMGLITGYLVLSFYIVVAGWALAYVFESASGHFVDKSPGQIVEQFEGLKAHSGHLMGWSLVILLGTLFVVGKGVQQGLEKAARYLMPGLFLLLVIIAIYAGNTGDFSQAAAFMFYPDFSKLTVNGVLIALGHAFFTLGLASGVMIVYGAYLPEGTSIARTSIVIGIADTLVAMLAGLAIFPIVFGNALEPSAGPGLIFQTLPIAFGQMPMGTFFGTVFFVMLVFAAFTSSIAMIESSIAYLIEKLACSRWVATAISGFVLWLMSLGTVFSLSGAEWAHFAFGDGKISIFDVVDFMTSNVLLPLGGLVVALFMGWAMPTHIQQAALQEQGRTYVLWRICIKWLAPVAIALVFLQLVGVLAL